MSRWWWPKSGWVGIVSTACLMALTWWILLEGKGIR